LIFVTIGMHSIGFDRLITKMDEISLNLDEKVIMQIGNSKYIPKNTEYFRLKTYPQIQEICKNARVIVAHGGTGSVITALKEDTPIITVPRIKEYGEVIDDQQIDFVKAMEDKTLVFPIYDLDNLENILTQNKFGNEVIKNDDKLVNSVINYIITLNE
tara:strand:- start:4002 stop:4475 length:474 start_codon:yes stop_codon:yes gene_type:complete